MLHTNPAHISSVSAIALGASVVPFRPKVIARPAADNDSSPFAVVIDNPESVAIAAEPEPEAPAKEIAGNATTDRAALTRALDITTNAVEKRNTIPVLSNVQLAADGAGNLVVVGTDLDIQISVSVPAAVDAHFATTLPAHTMRDFLKKATASDLVDITTSPDDGCALLDFERVNYKLHTLPVADFPAMPFDNATHSFAIAGADLVKGFGAVDIAISTEETRYYLNGVYLHHVEPRAIDAYNGDKGALRMAATDGHRLCRQDLPASDGCAGMPGVIIPRKTVALIQKLMKGKACPASVAIELSETKMRFSFDDVVITTKLIDGSFPDYQRVIPSVDWLRQDGKLKEATFNADKMSEGIRAVSLISSERGRSVKMVFSADKCQLVVNNPDKGAATADIAVAYDSDLLEIGFNASYLQDFLALADGGDVIFALQDAGAPVVVTVPGRDGWLGVQMPMRV